MIAPKDSKSPRYSYNLAKKAAQIAFSKKAKDVAILDLRDLTSITDYFVICTGDVDVHVKAIVDEIKVKLKPEVKPWHIEGYQHLNWVLMDYVDFVVHIFQEDIRNYYNLERLWADAPVEIVENIS
ncbi:MAG: ribosome silencing factor [Candidatus Neomarinimicrobiota bacterium]|nr:MAG: ribosome silencing factor [Candidatus Neomarinimicrobiota bacterium]